MLLSGWLFRFQALAPDFSRLSPVAGLRRIFSWHGLIELGRAALKTLLVGGVTAAVVWNERAEIFGLVSEPLEPAIVHLGHLLGVTFLAVAGALLLVVMVDVPLQIRDYARQLRMTREEVRQELSENEGNTQIKARQRALQRAATQPRMFAEVARADVVVTDATHCAVALSYRDGAMAAPRVVAMGTRPMAERIVQLGRDADVPVLRSPPLARALFTHAQVGQDIPAALYAPVAEVLAWVYQLRRFANVGGEAPREPSDVRVPPGLDPGE
jgi:flagellar biosynthetic protein FlhB